MSESKLKTRSAPINSPGELRTTYARCIPAAMALCVFSLSSQSLLAGDCGPGPHWIDGCDTAEHIVNTHASLRLDTALDENLDGRRDVTVDLTGSAVVRQTSGLDHSMQTEIISMELVGSVRGDTVTLRAGQGAGQGPGTLASSIGTITELPGDGSQATSSYDIFFELESEILGYFYNRSPLQIGAILESLPVDANYTHEISSGSLVQLFAANGSDPVAQVVGHDQDLAASMPEPATLVSLLLGALALGRTGRREV